MDDAADIFFVTRKWPPAMGGMETYAKRLTDELSNLALLQVVALPGRNDGQPPSTWALLRFPLTVLRRWLALKRPPDVLHIADMAMWPIAMLSWLSSRQIRVILSAHGTDVSFSRRGGIRGYLYGLYLRLGGSLFKKARVIANSGATAVAVSEVGWRLAATIPLATDIVAPPVEGTHNGRLLFAGRIVKLKGCAWFVGNVLPLIPAEIELDVAGTIWDHQEARVLADSRVNYLGVLRDQQLIEAYRSALCVIVPNVPVETHQFEGFGLVAPEAAASGGVVLASRRDGLIDAVIDNQTGFLLPSGDALAWRDKIKLVSNWSAEERQAFARESQQVAIRNFNWKRVARDTLAAYAD